MALEAGQTGDQGVAGSIPQSVATFFVEIDHEIFSTVILFLPLIQEWQLSVSGKRMCTSTGTKPAHEKVWLGKLIVLNLTLIG